MNSKYIPYLIVGVIAFALCFLYFPPFDIFFDDKEIFKYTGFLIAKGKVPYKDFFDHKPPLIFFINFLSSLVGNWGLYILDAMLVMAAALKFLQVNIKYKVCFPIVLPIIFLLILKNSTISFGLGMTREYTTILLLMAFCGLLSTHKYKYFFQGLFAALIFFLQQEQIIIFLPFFISSLIFDLKFNVKKLFQIFTQFLLGCLVITVPIVFYFLINGALLHFWQSAFLFNSQWYTGEIKPSFFAIIVQLKNYIYDLKFEILLIGALLMAGVSLFFGNKKKGFLIAAIISIPFSFISEFLSGKLTMGNASTAYYLLPLAATIPFTLFLVFAFTEKQIFQNKIHQFIYSALFLINLILNIIVYKTNYYKYSQDYIRESKELLYLSQYPPKDYELYIFNNSNYTYAYNKFEVLTPSKWLYHFFWNWYPNWDNSGQILHSITKDLKVHQTKYIIYDKNAMNFKSATNARHWNNFIDSFYKPVPGLILWEKK